jgi:aminopeptidase-like protein
MSTAVASNQLFEPEIFQELLKLHLGLAQPDNKQAMDLIGKIVPLTTQSYDSGSEHNGWVIPNEWSVQRAEIRKDDEVLFEGTGHALAVAQMSSTFKDKVSKDVLDQHVYFNKEIDDAYVFHCRYMYRPWESHWGLCVPWRTYRDWGDGEYDIALETKFSAGQMIVGETRHEGELPDSICFQAHTCHPGQANDNLVGVMVITELFRWLAARDTRYSYTGLFAPEHIGTVFYLRDKSKEELEQIKLGCFVEAVGTQGQFALQHSFLGDRIHDRMLKHVLAMTGDEFRTGPFATILVNDESVWEAPGIEMPMISLSRFPYDQYHTSRDGFELMDFERMSETLELIKELVDMLEQDVIVHREFDGLIALSNPKYDLYWEHPDPTYDKGLSDMDLRFARMQDLLPRYFNGKHTAFTIAEKFGIPFGLVRNYLEQFAEKGLVQLEPVPGIDYYHPRWEPNTEC